MTDRFYRLRVVFLAVVLLVFVVSCATRVTPGGGPKDEKGPVLVAESPENGAVGVDRMAQIRIEFDERINAEAKHVFVSPGYPEFEVKVRARGFALTPLDTMRSNTTYVINISSDVEDLRNNELNGGHQLAFSTGGLLDTLRIGGRVFDEELEPARGASCCLWKLPFDSLRVPDYIGWADSTGNYTIKNLGRGNYVLGAFDRLSDEHLPRLDKPYGIATHVATVPAQEKFDLLMTERDTTELTVKSINQKGMYMVDLSLSGKVKVIGGTVVESDPGAELDLFPKNEFVTKVSVLNRKRFAKGVYDLTIDGLTDMNGNEVSIDSIDLEIRQQVDTLPPYPTKRSPSYHGKLDRGNPIELTFGLPVNYCELECRFRSTDTTGISDTVDVDVQARIVDPFHVIGGLKWPGVDFRKGEYRIIDVGGLNGGQYSDTGWVQFAVMEPQEGGSVVITALPFTCETPIVSLIGRNEEYPVFNTDSGFTASGIRSGNYTLFVFCDADGDSLFDGGGIFPLRFGEIGFVHPDSVGIRNKWVTEVGK